MIKNIASDPDKMGSLAQPTLYAPLSFIFRKRRIKRASRLMDDCFIRIESSSIYKTDAPASVYSPYTAVLTPQ